MAAIWKRRSVKSDRTKNCNEVTSLVNIQVPLAWDGDMTTRNQRPLLVITVHLQYEDTEEIGVSKSVICGTDPMDKRLCIVHGKD